MAKFWVDLILIGVKFYGRFLIYPFACAVYALESYYIAC